MTIRIAHLSDIHFGGDFDPGVWKDVVYAVKDFEPQVIVVSGDLVDHPAPGYLLAAKCALNSLATSAGAELCVVPGNHDLFEYGTAIAGRLDWYERIFHNPDTSRAEAALRKATGIPELGFNALCEDGSAFWSSLKSRVFGSPVFARDLPEKPLETELVWIPSRVPVLFALLDSNPTGRLDLATGLVGNEQLRALDAQLKSKAQVPCLARIAVIHHHVLPVAYAAGSHDRQESAMVLRDAGTVLHVLAGYKFDLILHGHWHRQQYARLNFATHGAGEYPIAVASAGSASMQSSRTDENSFNFITIGDSGRITVESTFYGGAQVPRRPDRWNRRLYREPIEAVRRRAFVRAQELHIVECDERRQDCEVSENGDLWVTHRFRGLRLHQAKSPYPMREHLLRSPPYGRFVHRTLRLSQESDRAGYRLDPPPAQPLSAVEDRCIIRLPRDLGAMEAADYEFTYACANSIAMTTWEAEQRHGRYDTSVLAAQGNREWVGLAVAHPTTRMQLRLKLPESLARTVPYVRCLRIVNVPDYEVNGFGDADLLKALRSSPPVPDDEETSDVRLRFDEKERTWRLEVREPMVGALYQLCWDLVGPDPLERPDGLRIQGETEEAQRLLLELGQRIASHATELDDQEPLQAFDLFRKSVEKQLGTGGQRERRSVKLWVYDRKDLVLRPVLSYRSWLGDLWPLEFTIPLGDGVAGAAFQQRRIVPWGRRVAPESLIEPVRPRLPPGQEEPNMEHMLGIPLYHPSVPDPPRPPPWATIGVLCFGSSSEASPVARLGGRQPDLVMQRKVLALRALAQKLVAGIINRLR